MKKRLGTIVTAALAGTALAGSAAGLGYIISKQQERIDEYSERLASLEQQAGTLEHLKADGEYDYNNVLVRNMGELATIRDSVYQVEARFVYKNSEGEEYTHQQRGCAVSVRDGYLYTAHHVTHAPETMRVGRVRNNRFEFSEYTLAQTHLTIHDDLGFEHELKEVYSNEDIDGAVYSVPPYAEMSVMPCAIGDSYQLQTGNVIYVVGRPLGLELNVREGIVSRERGNFELIPRDKGFMTSAGINFGDSGGMVLAIRDGRFELVGINHAKAVGNGAERLGELIGVSALEQELLRAMQANPRLQYEHPDLYESL